MTPGCWLICCSKKVSGEKSGHRDRNGKQVDSLHAVTPPLAGTARGMKGGLCARLLLTRMFNATNKKSPGEKNDHVSQATSERLFFIIIRQASPNISEKSIHRN